jgi:hypothetical protein
MDLFACSRYQVHLFCSILLLLLAFSGLRAQDREDSSSGFEWGLSLGVHFPGDRSASFYNGDAPDGRIESLLNRPRVRREVRETLDRDFSFSAYTPAGDMSYQASYNVGLNARFIPEGNGASIQGELLYSRLKTEEFFYLAVQEPGKAVPERKPYSVNGQEDRVRFLLNIHAEGEGRPLRSFARGGVAVGYAQATRNRISIEDLSYSILPSDHPRYGDPEIQKGMILGGQGELGVKLITGSDWDISLSGRISYDRVDIGSDPGFDFQGGIFFRLLRNSF